LVNDGLFINLFIYYNIFLPGLKPRRQLLKTSAVPSKFAWTSESAAAAVEAKSEARSERITAREIAKMNRERAEMERNEQSPEFLLVSDGCEAVVEAEDVSKSHDVCLQVEPSTVHQDTQTPRGTRDSLLGPRRRGIRIEDYDDQYTDDKEEIKMYTGLESCLAFYTVLQSLGPAATCLTFLYGSPELDAANQFFLTLIKLRTYKTNKEIALLFRIKEPEVYNIFVTWVRFMSLQWREVDIWPSREMVDYYFPIDFKSKFPSTRVIFDGTEIPIKKQGSVLDRPKPFWTSKMVNTVIYR
jgi:hypothetical protein